MDKLRNQRRAYASVFGAFLVKELSKSGWLGNINQVILFGSVARGDASSASDIDIFIDVETPFKKFESDTNKIVEKYYEGKDALLFKSEGIDNKINVIVGKLIEWKDLHRSIMSTGIVLWGPYRAETRPSATKHKVIFYWEGVGKNRGAFLNKLYGYKIGEKAYPGLFQKLGGEKIGKSCAIFPVENREKVIDLFKHHEVKARILEVFVG